MIHCSPRSRWAECACFAVVLCLANGAHAHGGPPAALGVLAADANGPSVVLLNEGIAAQRGDRWMFMCPSLWGDVDLGSGKVPLALSVDGTETWIAGSDDLYAAHGGRLTRQNQPGLSSSHVTALVSFGVHVYGLRIASEGEGSEVVRVGATAEPPLWRSNDYFSTLAADADKLYLGRLVTDLEVGFVTLDREGTVLQESRAVTNTLTARVQLQPTPAALFAVTYDGLSSTLHRFDGTVWRRVQTGEGVAFGPQASPGGQLWMVLNGVLLRERGGVFEPAGETRAPTCLGEWGGKPYACVDDEMFWLTEDGLGERCFHLEGLAGPDAEVVPPSAARECDFQWTLFRNDLMLAGLAPQEWRPAGSPVAPSAGSGGAPMATAGSVGVAGTDAAAGSPAADGGGATTPERAPAESGCSCTAAGASPRGSPVGPFAIWCAGWLVFARRRARQRAAWALGWLRALVPLALAVATSVVLGQSVPPIRADRPDAERRALAVATYDGGEVTVGEIEDTIAASSPLVQLDAKEPAALRAVLARNLQFELMAIEAERRGYGERPAVREAVKQNAVHRLLASEVDAKLPPELQAFSRARPSPERDARIEGLIADLRKTEPRAIHPELLSLIQFEDPPEAAAAPE